MDSLKPERRFSHLFDLTSNSSEIISPPTAKLKQVMFLKNRSQLNSLALNAVCDSVNAE